MAIVLGVVAALAGFLLPPALADLPARHRLMIGALAGVLLAAAIGSWVEARYRAMLASAGML